MVKLGWKHVKGHSGDRWNDRADRLAAEGSEQSTPERTSDRKRKEAPSPLRGLECGEAFCHPQSDCSPLVATR